MQYYLTLNEVTPDPNDYRAVVQVNDTKSVDHVIDNMISRGSTVTKAEALSTIEEYYRALAKILEEGNGINTPAYSIAPSIRGVFYEGDRYDKNKHKVMIKISANERLSEVAPKIKLEKMKTPERLPILNSFQDPASSTMNEIVTPAESACIKGEAIRFDPTDQQQGIFFIAEDGSETRVKTVLRNMPSELIFTVPASLTAGTYILQVRTVMKEGKGLKSASFSNKLTVS